MTNSQGDEKMSARDVLRELFRPAFLSAPLKSDKYGLERFAWQRTEVAAFAGIVWSLVEIFASIDVPVVGWVLGSAIAYFGVDAVACSVKRLFSGS